jgi:hypothetical protein
MSARARELDGVTIGNKLLARSRSFGDALPVEAFTSVPKTGTESLVSILVGSECSGTSGRGNCGGEKSSRVLLFGRALV